MNSIAPRPGIMDIVPYASGESEIEGFDRVINLASNESPLGPSRLAIEAYHRIAAGLARYPDGGWTDLVQAIAVHHGPEAERIVCSTGSENLIAMIASAYTGPGDEVVFSEHGFISYRLATQMAGATPVTATDTPDLANDVDGLLAAVSAKTRIVFLANPNNPTGTLMVAAELRRLRQGLRQDVLLVIDAAYAEYVNAGDYTPGDDLVADSVENGTGNVVMLRTFSKIYGLAGLRVGWAYCAPDVLKVLNRVRGTFNVTAPAQAAAAAALADREHLAKAKAHNDEWLPWLEQKITAAGFRVTPGAGNFTLAHFEAGDKSSRAADAFLRSRGIIVRPVAGYGLPDSLRITVGLADENEALAAALGDFGTL